MRLLSWMPPSVAVFVYTTVFKPKPLRLLAQAVIKRMIPRQIQIEGATLLLNQDDAVISGSLTLGCYESFARTFFATQLQPGQCVIDIGANIGLYTVMASQRVGPAGRVIAIEPDPVNISFLRGTLELNEMSNVTAVQAALSNETGSGLLFLDNLNKGRHCVFDPSGKRPSVKVELCRLDDLLDRLSVKTVDLIKMDVEGAEFLVVQGMTRMLEANPRLRIMTEFWPWGIRRCGGDPAALLATFRSARFEVHEVTDRECKLVPPAEDQRLLGLVRERQRTDLFLRRSQG